MSLRATTGDESAGQRNPAFLVDDGDAEENDSLEELVVKELDDANNNNNNSINPSSIKAHDDVDGSIYAQNNGNINGIKSSSLDASSQLLIDAIDNLESQSRKINSGADSFASGAAFFDDGKRRVDYVLAYNVVEGRKEEEEEEEEAERATRRNFFTEELTSTFGLELEEADSTELAVKFVKVHAPWEVSE